MSEIINGKIERFEGMMVVIKTADGTELQWPIAKLTPELQAGDRVTFTLASEQNNSLEKEWQAKKMLNDILNVEPERDH